MRNYINDIIKMFAHGDYPTDVRRTVHRWLGEESHSEEKDSALREVWENARQAGIPANMNQSLRTMCRNVGFADSPSISIVKLRVWQAAACLFILVSLASVYKLISDEHQREADLIQSYTPCADMKTVTLPDGTQVNVNSESTLLYPDCFNGNTRSVYLVGEASFKVKPDKEHPFIVKSNDFQVTALGTEFQVTAYPNESHVSATLLSGSVKVEYNNMSANVILKPSEQLVYDKHTKSGQVVHPDLYDETAWQRGELVFSNMELEDILTRLERKYPYTFVYSHNSLKRDTYSFRFPPKATLEEVMGIIAQVVNINYKITGKKCYLTNKQR